MRNPRHPNETSAILLDYPDGGSVYLESGPLYDRAAAGEFGPVAPCVPTPPSPAQIKAKITRAIDAHVEARALLMRYNSAAHMASYVASTNATWAAEAQAFVAWRDRVWLAALAMLDRAQVSGEVPTAEDVINALPDWPGV